MDDEYSESPRNLVNCVLTPAASQYKAFVKLVGNTLHIARTYAVDSLNRKASG